MNIRELFDIILVESGQDLLAETDLELNVDSFSRLVRRVLSIYNLHVPYSVPTKIITALNKYTFVENPDLGTRIPDWISDVIPLVYSATGTSAFALQQKVYGNMEIKREFPWRYEKPDLFLPYTGEFEVIQVFYHQLREVSENGKKEYYLDTIDLRNSSTFIDLSRALFLQSIGKSRRAFTHNEIPIQMDADAMISEGKELETEAKERLVEQDQKFYLAYR